MATFPVRMPAEEIVRRGDKIFETRIRPQLVANDAEAVVAIDADTGAFAVAKDALSAADQLRKLAPDAQVFIRRVGARALHHLGGYRR